MNILVYEINMKAKKENMYQMNKIICPECKEDILININEYKKVYIIVKININIIIY